MSSDTGDNPAPSPARNRSEILADALALFEGGRNWIKNHLWEDHDDDVGNMDMENIEEAAVSAQNFCAYGAIMKSMALHGEREELRAIVMEYNAPSVDEEGNRIVKPYNKLLAGDRPIVSANDEADSFEEVREMFCHGINKALEEEAIEAGVAEPEAPLINPTVAPAPSGDSPTGGPTGPPPSCRIDPATGLVVCS